MRLAELCWDEMRVSLPAGVRAQVHDGEQLVLGVRPATARILPDLQPVTEGLSLRGQVEAIEPDFGREIQLVYARTGPFFYAGQGPLDPSLNVGDDGGVAFPQEALYFFGGEGERRVPAEAAPLTS